MEFSTVHKVRLLRILIIPFIFTFIFSTYKSYQDYSLKQFETNHPSSVELNAWEKRVFIDESFKLEMTVQNLCNYEINKDSLIVLMQQINPNWSLKDLEILNVEKENVLDNEFVSFTVSATYFSDSPTPRYSIQDTYLYNSDGAAYQILGVFPEVKELGTYKFVSQSNEIMEGDEFSLELQLENVDKISKLPKISFQKSIKISSPVPRGKPIIQTSDGIKGTKNIVIKQRFTSSSPGWFNIKAASYQLNNKNLVIHPISIRVRELIKSFEVKFDKPKFVDQQFSIKVFVYNVPNSNRKPIFPNIRDCTKEKLKIDKEKINNKYSSFTYVQNYRVNYDGEFEVNDLIVYMGQEQEKYKLSSFEIEFDCSSINKVRLTSGIEPVKLSGRVFGSDNNIAIQNNNSEDIFVKVINISRKKAVRCIYIRANQKATVNDLPAGTYYLAVAYGSHWDRKYNRFRCKKSFAIFDKSDHIMKFNSWEYGTWEMTLYKITSRYSSSQSPRSVGESTFENY